MHFCIENFHIATLCFRGGLKRVVKIRNFRVLPITIFRPCVGGGGGGCLWPIGVDGVPWQWRREGGTPERPPPEIGKIVVEIWCYLPEVYTFGAESEIQEICK